MRLSEILPAGVPAQPLSVDPEILGLAEDSRSVKPGYLFAGLAGTQQDGAQYLAAALEQGASAVLTHGQAAGLNVLRSRTDIPVVVSQAPRSDFARLAAHYFAPLPAQLVAVTGTNGKTSVASFVRQILQKTGVPAASLGTLGIVTEAGTKPLRHTTPDPVTLFSALGALKAEGIDAVALEASSHGLHQGRMAGVEIAAAAFTNITRDHLDYHETFEAYFAAKALLFTDVLPNEGTAVLNADKPEVMALEAGLKARGIRLIDFGRQAAVLRLVDQQPEGGGQRLRLAFDGKEQEVRLALAGAFQAENVLAAAGLCIALGQEAEAVFAALAHLTGVPGRLERIVPTRTAGEATVLPPVYVDYAHTPDALETALRALRPHTQKRLICVIGCGGDRDRGKRPQMGRVASERADLTIITDDNPRSEDPASIRASMLKGAGGASDTVREIGDRHGAIHAALTAWQPGDVVMVAGKGHETGQIIGDVIHPFDDRAVVSAALAAWPELSAATTGETR